MSTIRRRLSPRRWDSVDAFHYDGADPVEKHVLVGAHGHAGHFGVRYFHVPAGGHTEHPRPHDHIVIIEHGHARVTVGTRVEDLGPGDIVVAPATNCAGSRQPATTRSASTALPRTKVKVPMTTGRVLYVIPECPHCERARQHLRAQGVDWEERDATTRADWRAELMEHSGGSGTVPTLVHNGQVVSVGWHGLGCHIGHFERWGPGPPPHTAGPDSA